MKQNRESRIEHYSGKLGLNRWDRKDLLEFYRLAKILKDEESKGNYFYTGFADVKKEYDKVAYKITKIGLWDTSVQLINSFLRAEKELFEEYQQMYPNLNNDEIYLKVYEEVDKNIDEEIANAKETRKQERKERSGCNSVLLITLILIIATLIVLL